jgi:hypothetical protein
MDWTGSGQGQMVDFYEEHNVHFHEIEPHSSYLLFTIIEKGQ